MTIFYQSFRRWLSARSVAMALTMVAIPVGMHAEEQDCLVVNLSDGTRTCYVLNDTPTATFVGTNLHIESASLSDDHELGKVSHFTFEKCDLSSIDVISAGERRITVTDSEVILEGFTPGATATMSDLQGRTYSNATVAADGSCTIKTGNLPAGVYLVSTTDGKSFKIYKK